jgi:hypothetical protein
MVTGVAWAGAQLHRQRRRERNEQVADERVPQLAAAGAYKVFEKWSEMKHRGTRVAV